MCFSPQGDLAGGVAVMAIGVEALRRLQGRRELAVVATLPLLLGAHQIDESLVWWGLQGRVPWSAGQVAMWIYLLFALVVLPILAPLLVFGIEPSRQRRRRIAPFLGLGVAVSAILLEAMLVGHPSARLGDAHLAYSIGLQHGVAIIGLYVLATCGPMLVSSHRDVVWFGIANLVAVVVLARLCADGFTSLWCAYAAVLSAAIVLHLRRTARRAAGAATVADARATR
jgi:Family of unknown function (DUF6629)